MRTTMFAARPAWQPPPVEMSGTNSALKIPFSRNVMFTAFAVTMVWALMATAAPTNAQPTTAATDQSPTTAATATQTPITPSTSASETSPRTSASSTTATPSTPVQGPDARQRLAVTGCEVFNPGGHTLCGDILDKYRALGAIGSFLGPPTTSELVNPDGYGRRTQFVNGIIYWSPSTGAHPVVNDFLINYGTHGWEGGSLRYPTTDEIVLPDRVGRRQIFEGGTIYWYPTTGAHTVWGAIGDDWGRRGWEQSVLGYPVGEETDSPNWLLEVGEKMQSFQGGTLFYSFSTREVTAAHWHQYGTQPPVDVRARQDLAEPPEPGPMITAQDVQAFEGPQAESKPGDRAVRPYATESCPADAQHPQTDTWFHCEKMVKIAARGNIAVPFRRGRVDPGGFGINHAFNDHSFEMHWAERILQANTLANDIDVRPDKPTWRDRYYWQIGQTFITEKGTRLQSLEVIIDRAPPNNGVDSRPLGLVTAFCRARDQNGSIQRVCPENIPTPFVHREDTAYDWSAG